MNKKQGIEKIKKLLLMQQCNGATKQEEITCFKKALEVTLVYDIKEIDLDSILRHIYNLEQHPDYNEPFADVFKNITFETELDSEDYDFEDNNFEDEKLKDDKFKYKPRRKDNLIKNITVGILLGGFFTWILRSLIKYIKGMLPFIIWIVIPFIIVTLFQNIKTFFGALKL